MLSATITPTKRLLRVSTQNSLDWTVFRLTFLLLTSLGSGCATSWLSDMPCCLWLLFVGHTAARNRLDSRSVPETGRMVEAGKTRSTMQGRK